MRIQLQTNRREAAKLITAACAGAALPIHLAAQQPAATDPTRAAYQFGFNQCGYPSGAAKVASVAVPANAAAPSSFTVERVADGATVLRGPLRPPQADAASGDQIALADFSTLHAPGQYRLRVGDSLSDPVVIATAPYQQALRLAMRSFYGQRCGCKVDLGGGYKHDLCHKQGAFHPSSGTQGKLKNTGGWHDAGDYGRYVVNSGISTGTLLWAWEMFPDVLRPLHLQIPESGHPTPDFLAEVRWNLQWMLSMQDPADGGVWHKQTSEAFCGFVMPEDDTLLSQVIGTGAPPFKSTCATADFAAVMAIAARCYPPYDHAFAASCLAAARHAYAWAQANPNIVFKNPPGVSTGEYGDNNCADELLWATAELFRTTGEPAFADRFEAACPAQPVITTPGWGNVQSMALWTYAMSPHPRNTTLRDSIQRATVAAAHERIARSQTNGYGNTLQLQDYTWGSNSVAANDALLLVIADRSEPNPAAREAALANLHYLLGRNCFGVSWVTQVGTRPFQQPHHRASQADKLAAPWPGLLSGGPNAHGGDPVANTLGQRPPMRMWVDDWHAYSMNEVAINWNAPLVFLLAAANHFGEGRQPG